MTLNVHPPTGISGGALLEIQDTDVVLGPGSSLGKKVEIMFES